MKLIDKSFRLNKELESVRLAQEGTTRKAEGMICAIASTASPTKETTNDNNDVATWLATTEVDAMNDDAHTGR